MPSKTDLCTYGEHYCIGCCIAPRKSPTKRELTAAITANTLQFKSFTTIEAFAKRKNCGEIRKCGICNNQIFIGKQVLCPLHPGNNKGKDLRKNKFCEKSYLCETQEEYNKWDEKTKKAFLRFIKTKKPDWCQYSINIDNGSYLREFKKIRRKKKTDRI